MGSTIAHRRHRLLVPMKIRADVGASLAAALAYEARLEIGEPDVIGHCSALIAIEWLQ